MVTGTGVESEAVWLECFPAGAAACRGVARPGATTAKIMASTVSPARGRRILTTGYERLELSVPALAPFRDN